VGPGAVRARTAPRGRPRFRIRRNRCSLTFRSRASCASRNAETPRLGDSGPRTAPIGAVARCVRRRV